MFLSLEKVIVGAQKGRTRATIPGWAHLAEQELADHAEDEVSPKYMQEEQDHQHDVEEVVAEEGRVLLDRVDPGAVDQPGEQSSHIKTTAWNSFSQHATEPNYINCFIFMGECNDPKPLKLRF